MVLLSYRPSWFLRSFVVHCIAATKMHSADTTIAGASKAAIHHHAARWAKFNVQPVQGIDFETQTRVSRGLL